MVQNIGKSILIILVVLAALLIPPIYGFCQGEGAGQFFTVCEMIPQNIFNKINTRKECSDWAFEQAKKELEVQLNILKAKTEPSQEDIEQIVYYKSLIKEGAVLTDTKEKYYENCKDIYNIK